MNKTHLVIPSTPDTAMVEALIDAVMCSASGQILNAETALMTANQVASVSAEIVAVSAKDIAAAFAGDDIDAKQARQRLIAAAGAAPSVTPIAPRADPVLEAVRAANRAADTEISRRFREFGTKTTMGERQMFYTGFIAGFRYEVKRND